MAWLRLIKINKWITLSKKKCMIGNNINIWKHEIDKKSNTPERRANEFLNAAGLWLINKIDSNKELLNGEKMWDEK